MEPTIHQMRSATRYLCIGFILASALANDPPPELARRVAETESKNAAERLNYTYRQSVSIQEFDKRGVAAGFYREIRDIIFSPESGRAEQFLKKPVDRLRRLHLTEEDFRDIREVQPFLFTKDHLWAYETRYRGEEKIDGSIYWVLDVAPRQVFQGQRLFDGTLWIDQDDLAVARATGRAVPDIFRGKTENLFPGFTTIRARVDGEHWFPIETYADDVLGFRAGPLRMRMRIEYSNYQRFTTESSIQFK